MTSAHYQSDAFKTPVVTDQQVLFALGIVLAFATFLAPPAPFIIDGGVYLDMARSMANHGALHIVTAGSPEGAPALEKYLTHEIGGKIYPQYPSGYAIIAAPFYMLFGVKGLMLLNAIGAGLSAWLTWRAAIKLYDIETARIAAALLVFATFLLNYAFSIWPHTLSLAFCLAAVNFAIDANDESQLRERAVKFALAGASIGVAINIRVDAILFAPILLVWVKIFARPADRISPIAILIGLIPGLMAAAMLNDAKFGVFAPITYGPKEGLTSLASYAPLMAAGAIFVTAILAVDVTAIYKAARKKFGGKALYLAAALVIGLSCLFLADFVARVIYGAYVLVIDLQAHTAYRQEGVERNEFGHLLYWGYPKKAFIQSLPFLPLIILPVLGFFQGRRVNATALCILAIAAPIVFYALNQWHGGGSYNMRYFMPATPFAAILTAVAFLRISRAAGKFERAHVLAVIVAAAILFQGMQFLGANSARFFAPAALYPQWVLAIFCLTAVVTFARRPHSRRAAQAAYFCALATFSYGAFVNLADEAGNEKTRAEQRAMSSAIAQTLPPDALVVTQLPVLLVDAEENGVNLMIADRVSGDDAFAAVTAYERAGRCVYFQNPMARDLVAPYLGAGAIDPKQRWVAAQRFDHDSQLVFYILASQIGKCEI